MEFKNYQSDQSLSSQLSSNRTSSRVYKRHHVMVSGMTLPQNYSADMDKLCFTEKYISDFTIEQKDVEYNESSVTKEVPSYFNIFESGRNPLDIPDMTYERAYMVTPKINTKRR